MLNLDFTGKVVIVTGAGGSLGKAYALEFAKRKAFVVVNDLGTSQDGSFAGRISAISTVAEIKFHGGSAVPSFDNVESGHKIVETAISHFGRIDVIVNNAGILLDKAFQNMTDDDWDLVYKTHVKGAYSVTKAAWPFFKKQRYGRIIFTSSNSAVYGNFGQANYAAAKNALVGLSHTLAIEGSRYGIKSNVIIPTASSRLTAQLFLEESLVLLKAEHVVPLVIYLGHDSCRETGGVFEAGAGWYGQIQTYRSKGMVIPAANAEAVVDNWSRITDMTSAKHFGSIQEVTADLLNRAEQAGVSEAKWELEKEKKDEYMELSKVIAEELNWKRHDSLSSSLRFMLLLTNGVDVYSFTISFDGDRGPCERESVCVIAIHHDLFEEILKGQLITEEIIRPGKLVIVGDIGEGNVIKCINQLAISMRPRL
uniref:Ketoreductase domain-containing protein n=1 Tax=Setaria digitata TaxID=48799 RepID=A0A915PIC0_9BILA